MPLFPRHRAQIENEATKDFSLQGSTVFQRAEDVKELIDLLNQHPHITKVDFSANGITDEVAKTLVELKHVHTLNLSWNYIFVEGAIVLVQNPNFMSIDLTRNGVSNENSARQLVPLTQQVELKLHRTEWSEISQETLSALQAKLDENKKRRETIQTHPGSSASGQYSAAEAKSNNASEQVNSGLRP